MNYQKLGEPAENGRNQLVVFILDEQRYALHLLAVERVACVVEIAPLPKAPEIVVGVIDLQGRIVPVVNIRKRFRLPDREMGLSNQLIIANTSRRTIAFVVDSVTDVAERAEREVITAEKILPGLEYLEGVMKLDDGIVFIHDLDRFFSLEEEKQLNDATDRL
jgi:purine-binding chemotaxis protein CheW